MSNRPESQHCIACGDKFKVTSDTGFHCSACVLGMPESHQPIGCREAFEAHFKNLNKSGALSWAAKDGKYADLAVQGMWIGWQGAWQRERESGGDIVLVGYARDLDGTGSLHFCADGDDGAIPLYANKGDYEQ